MGVAIRTAMDANTAERLAATGAVYLPGAAAELLLAIEAAISSDDCGRPGARLRDAAALAALLSPERAIGRAAAGALAAIGVAGEPRPVRAILFDKNADANWALGWHQDRTVAVRERHPCEGFGPWTIKQGVIHVAPPFALLRRMVTLRIHLDSVDADNAPLLIAEATHDRLWPEGEIAGAVAAACVHPCLAARGDIWAYATPILHASAAATRPRRRRVLQVDFAAEALPAPLAWRGI